MSDRRYGSDEHNADYVRGREDERGALVKWLKGFECREGVTCLDGSDLQYIRSGEYLQDTYEYASPEEVRKASTRIAEEWEPNILAKEECDE